MAKKCDFYFYENNKDICMIKKEDISYKTYNEYCKYDNFKECPIYLYYLSKK